MKIMDNGASEGGGGEGYLFVTGNESDLVVALAKASGAVAWRAKPTATAGAASLSYSHYTTALAAHPPSRAVVFLAGCWPFALDADTGAVRWAGPQLSGLLGRRPTVAMDSGAFAHEYAHHHDAGGGGWFPGTAETAAQRALRDLAIVGCNWQVHATRLSDGAALWRFQRADVGRSPMLLIEDGVLYVAGDGALIALDAASGKEIWTARPDGFPKSIPFVIATLRSSPLYRPSNYDPSSPNPVPQLLAMPDPDDGDKKPPAPAPPERRPLYVGEAGTVVRVDPATGKTAASPATHPPIALRKEAKKSRCPTAIVPLPSRARVAACCGPVLGVYDAASGTPIWESLLDVGDWIPTLLVGPGAPPLPSRPAKASADAAAVPPPPPSSSLSSSTSASVAPQPGFRLYVSTDTSLWCLHAATGLLLWKHKFGFDDPAPACLLAHHHHAVDDADADAAVYVAGSGVVHRIDPRTGARVWKRRGGGARTVASDAAGTGESNRSLQADVARLFDMVLP